MIAFALVFCGGVVIGWIATEMAVELRADARAQTVAPDATLPPLAARRARAVRLPCDVRPLSDLDIQRLLAPDASDS